MNTLPKLASIGLTMSLLLCGPAASAAESPLDVVVLVDMQPHRNAAERLFTTNMDGTPRVNRAIYPARLNACLLRNVTVPADLKSVTDQS
jgi:hypothetical protein